MIRTHVVKEGEKLSAIAALHGVSVRDVVAANPTKPRIKLSSGQQVFRSLDSGETIRVPALGDPAGAPAHASCPSATLYDVGTGACKDANTGALVAAPTCDGGLYWKADVKACWALAPNGAWIPPATSGSDPIVGMADPSAVHCAQSGGQNVTRTLDTDGRVTVGDKIFTGKPGDQIGGCVFPDGTECATWDYLHGTCGPGGYARTCEYDSGKMWSTVAVDEAGNIGACVPAKDLASPFAKAVPWAIGAIVLAASGAALWFVRRTPSTPAAAPAPAPARSSNPVSKIIAVSKDRYRATASERRLHGGKTVTEFYVFRAEDEKNPGAWKIVRGYGPTPGQRKTDAIRRSGLT